MPLKAGETHDIVIHLNNSISLGLISKPQTYRVDNAPTFIPRFAVGDPRGADFNKWRSFVQDDFSGGAGQITLTADRGNNRYAESKHVEVGLPEVTVTQAAVVESPTEYIQEFATRGQEIQAAARVAVLPMVSSAVTTLATVFSSPPYGVFLVANSNAPMLFHNITAMIFTQERIVPGPIVSIGTPPVPPQNAVLADWAVNVADWADLYLPTGGGRAWAVAATNVIPQGSNNWPVTGAVAYSNVVVLAKSVYGLTIYGSTNNLQPANFYKPPVMSTNTNRVHVFDSKLWRTWFGNLAYWNTPDNVWSSYIPIGEAQYSILNTASFAGKLYLGKEEGLWAWEAGRVYEVQSFLNEVSGVNFSVMLAHRGSLYFNILNSLYRLSSANLVEVIQLPNLDGQMVSAASIGPNLYLLIRTKAGGSTVWMLNTELGGVSQLWDFKDFAHQGTGLPNFIGALYGQLWIAPVSLTTTGTSQTHRIATVNRLTPPLTQAEPNFYGLGEQAKLVTSQLNMGYPGLEKLFNRVVITHQTPLPTDFIDVYYMLDMSRVVPIVQVYGNYLASAPVSSSNLTATLTDGLASLGNPTVDFAEPGGTEFRNGNELYIGARSPFDRLDFVFPTEAFYSSDSSMAYEVSTPTIETPYSTWIIEYWTGSVWRSLSHYVDGTKAVPGSNLLQTGTPRPFNKSGYLSFTPPKNWKSTTVNGVAGYYLRWTVVSSDGLFDPAASRKCSEITASSMLFSEEWTLLGTVSGNLTRYTALSFPDYTVGRTITLMFVLRGTEKSTPVLLSYEIEYQPVGPNKNLIRASAVALAINNLETLQPGVVENSAHFISTALFSMNGAGLPYTVQLPYPPPVAHTRRMLVSIASPGVAPPVLAYGHTNALGTGAVIEAEVPIILDEV